MSNKKIVDENREYVQNIVKTLIFLGRQGISLRGHHENEVSLNRGKFLELLMFQAKSNRLINHFLLTKKKVQHILVPGIQNELLDIIGEKIRDIQSMKLKMLKCLP